MEESISSGRRNLGTACSRVLKPSCDNVVVGGPMQVEQPVVGTPALTLSVLGDRLPDEWEMQVVGLG